MFILNFKLYDKHESETVWLKSVNDVSVRDSAIFVN